MDLPLSLDHSEDELIAAAREDQVGAWEGLVRRYYAPLLRYLTAQTGDPEEAADLAQQTFTDAFRRRDQLGFGRPFAPWLYQIARYNLLPWWRRRGRQPVSLEALIDTEGGRLSASRQPEETAKVEERDAIERVLDQLSPLLREALLLHELAGLTARESAVVLGISEAAAERRIGRALSEFRQRYTLPLAGSDRAEPSSG